jgi:hydroxymethylpyrimidine kinase/phosphomethylpyrimidine kinase/thiamine-phosphate diphosphorylase
VKSVLTIAGSDPSGGAGIQQDLRVFAALGVAGLSAITAITVQNSQGVRSVHPVDAEILGAQIEAILEDATDLCAVKIGMLGGAAQVRVVAEMLRRFRPPNVVLDPVLASTGGVPLLDEEGRAALVSELFPLCDLVTPNALEAALFSAQESLETEADVATAGQKLLAFGPKAVLIKGGHFKHDKSNDYLLRATDESKEEPAPFYGDPIDTTHTHGTGCFLSSAIASYLSEKDDLILAINRAKVLLEQGLRDPVIAGVGRGYPDIITGMFGPHISHVNRLARLKGLYVLTDPDLRPDRSTEEIVKAALSGGAKIIQLRNKHLSTPALIEEAKIVRKLTDAAGALFIVNDRVDVALASKADGVHVGPEDMSPRDARRLMGRHKLVGISVGTVEEAKSLAPMASYVAVGAIFGSSTKSDAGDAVGVERIREIKAAFPNKPIVAIGGINLANIDTVIAAGADSAAVISAVVCAPDMTEATRELVSRFPAGETANAAN